MKAGSWDTGWRKICLLAVIVFGHMGGSLALADTPKKTIKINFDSTTKLTESCGAELTPTKSSFGAEDRAKIIAKVQEKYDCALGERKVTVMEGSGGDAEIVVNGGKQPDSLPAEYGDAGKPGKPGVAHEGVFKDNGFTGDGLLNAVAETIAHEAGHKFGCSHNCDDPPKLMTKGGEVSMAEREPGDRKFSADDIAKLKESICGGVGSSEQKDTVLPTDVGVESGETLDLAEQVDDGYFTADLFPFPDFPVPYELGYMSDTNEFVFQLQVEPFQDNFTTISFPYSAGVDFAVRIDGQVFALSNSPGGFELFEPNPVNPQVFLGVNVFQETPFGPLGYQLFAQTPGQHTGGFKDAQDQPCLADCNGDGVLNILDFICFQALFESGDVLADCNGDGLLNILDFICFQAAFEQGCN